MTDLGRVAGALDRQLRIGSGILLLTDYDGTLAPIVADPAAAAMPAAVREALETLAGSDRIRVGIVSGRSVRDLRRRVGVTGIVYAGCHGLEIEGPGMAWTHPEADAKRGEIRVLGEALRRQATGVPGAWVEPKGLSVAIHYRDVAPGLLRRLEAALDEAIAPRRGLFRVLRGKKVIEVMPGVDWNKGRCAVWIRDRLLSEGRPRLVTAYLGDDVTDEVAFAVLEGQAITIRVGCDGLPTAATWCLRGVTDVAELLARLAVAARTEGFP